MFGALKDNLVLKWIITLMLEMTFAGFCIVFIGAGLTELKKKKNILRNLILIITGGLLFLLSLWATFLLLQ